MTNAAENSLPYQITLYLKTMSPTNLIITPNALLCTDPGRRPAPVVHQSVPNAF